MKTKRKSERPQLLYKRDIRKMEMDIAHKMQVLLLSYLMDELDYDADKIIEVNAAMNRYLEAIEEKLITVRTVEQIIEENTGLHIDKA